GGPPTDVPKALGSEECAYAYMLSLAVFVAFRNATVSLNYEFDLTAVTNEAYDAPRSTGRRPGCFRPEVCEERKINKDRWI
ncbi:MAG: hypothetical protein ACRDIB_01250, partial [Ardenticatenaceae bacterium]